MQYVKIKEAIAEQIESGMLLPSQKLPAERQLAESFNTTRVTLREALSLLEAEGLIYREDRRGWFISPAPFVYDPKQTLSFVERALQQNRIAKTQLCHAQSVLANQSVSKQLQLPPFSKVHHIDRVRYLDNRPVVYMTHYVKSDLFPDLLEQDLTLSLTQLYRTHYQKIYQGIHYRISAASLFGERASALRATAGSPVTLIERTHVDQQGVFMAYDVEYWRHDAMCIESVVEIK